jgi:hypothetical protein
MLRLVWLAVALLLSGSLYAQEKPAQTSASAPLCSDYEEGFPSCDISKADKKRAKKLYEQAHKLSGKKQFELALDRVKAARAISPFDIFYESVQKKIEVQVVAEAMRTGNKALLGGDAKTALTSFRRATEIDPTNEFAEQRLRDAMPLREEIGAVQYRAALGETRLQPLAGVRSFEFKGTSTQAFEQFAKLFGITLIIDQGLIPRNVRVKLDNVSWETGSQILERVSKFLIIPIDEHQALLANDTLEARSALIPMSLRTFYPVGGSTPKDLTDLSTALRVLFDLRFITPNAAQGTIVIRAPQPTMDAITSFLQYLNDEQPTVMLEVKVFQVSTTLTRDLGTSVPTQFSVFNVSSEVNSLVNSSTYQQIVAALQASGQTVNATTILGALLASASSSSTSSVLSQPFATFGGGLTLSGVTIPESSVHFSNTNSLSRTVDDLLLRAEEGKAATMKIGERYPIVSSMFSAASAASSLLSTLGLNAASVGTTTIPTPQFTYEDLGLVLKATPHVHGKLVSLEYEMTLRSLGATEANGLPDIINREMKGTISTNDGESIVLAGMVDKSEMAAINGIPLVSSIPVLGSALSVQTKENTADELLVVIKPHILSGGSRLGSYIPIPTNVPK